MDWSKAEPSSKSKTRIDDAINEIQQIIDLCSKNGIKLIIFTNPMHIITYEYDAKRDYFDFLERLAAITEFYNFSSINDITTNNENYFDTSHYKLSVGDMIIDAIFNKNVDKELRSQGFGYYVTKDNRDGFINMLKEQIQ
jgi:beta-glucosidase/6-phospho-beta-glucosidase/beta-galactosidase